MIEYWSVDYNAVTPYKDHFLIAAGDCNTGAGWKEIALVYDGETNAKKIAALPQVLAALSTMLGVAETDCLDDKSNVWRSAMINARAAIAKAEGKS